MLLSRKLSFLAFAGIFLTCEDLVRYLLSSEDLQKQKENTLFNSYLMDIFKEIIDWSKRRHPWEALALRKLWSGTLDGAGKNEILELLKSDSDTQSDALTEADLPKTTVKGEEVILKAMYDLENVNALTEDAALRFAARGVTITYGACGSGKTSTSRVLKRAGRARGTQEILHNIHDTEGPTGPAKATFLVSDSTGADKPIDWEDGTSGAEEMQKIAVFDAQSARIYVDGKEPILMPYGLDVFPKLGELATELKEGLSTELKACEPPALPIAVASLSDEHEAGKLVKDIVSLKGSEAPEKFNPLKDRFDKLKTLSETEESRLSQLRKSLALDPTKLAVKKERLLTRVKKFYMATVKANSLLSTAQFDYVGRLLKAAYDFKRAAEIASREMLENQPLPGVDSNEWTALYQAAREFSGVAYPGMDFPVTGEDKLCVLCMQPLSEDACKRFAAFDKHVEQTAKKKSEAYFKGYDVACSHYDKLGHEFQTNDTELIADIEEVKPGLGEQIEDYFRLVREGVSAVSIANAKGEWSTLSPIVSGLSADLIQLMSLLGSEVVELKKASDPDAQKKLEEECVKLEARKLLLDHETAIKSHIEGLKKCAVVRSAIRKISTRGISEKGRELTTEAVTTELKKAFGDELDRLGVGYLREKVNMDDYPSAGKVYQQLKVSGKGAGNFMVSDVLSDGEQRMVALASFLAELNTGKQTCGIVFDDPVSSVHHRWRQAIAKRLVEEGRNRQVMIFTHDVVFLMELLDAQREVGDVAVYQQLLEARGGRIGICEQGKMPWEYKSATERIPDLEDDLKILLKLNDDGNADYPRKVKEFYGRMRETWERSVELNLFCGVVTRFKEAVNTKELRYVSVEKEDVDEVNSGMTICSRWGAHDAPIPRMSEARTPEQCTKDLEDLKSHIDKLEKRKAQVEKERGKMDAPPKPEVVTVLKSKANKRKGLNKLRVTVKYILKTPVPHWQKK